MPNTYLFSKYTREDGKYTVETASAGSKPVYLVKDADGNLVETFKTMKAAKAAYEDR